MARQQGFSKWWPISFFIAAVLFFIMGGGMLGGWAANTTTYYSSYSYDYYTSGYSGLFYGGVACCVIGGICKLVAWILLIVYCVKRSRSPSTVYVNQAPMNNYPMQSNVQTAYMPVSNPATPAPMYPNQGMRYCSNCGSAITTSFCPQCGVKS